MSVAHSPTHSHKIDTDFKPTIVNITDVNLKPSANKNNEDDKLNTILIVLRQMQDEMKINTKQINMKIDEQNSQIKDIVNDNNKEK